jgi:TrmH family RNA methyltransferase
LITSLQNPRVKAAVQLRLARERQKQRRIIIDGARELIRALKAGVELVEVFVCEELCTSDECRQLLASLAKPVAHGNVPSKHPAIHTSHSALFYVSPAVFAKLAFGDRAEGVVAIAKTPSKALASLTLPSNPLVAVLEGVEKPGNVGAVLRSADAAGVSALVIADGGTDLYNPNTIRASLGTIFALPVCATSSAEALAWLRQQGLVIYAASVDAALEYTQADFTQPCAIVLGSEADGLSDRWRPKPGSVGSVSAITPIKLPMLGVADSLNISAAAAVLFYEALRQRHRTS